MTSKKIKVFVTYSWEEEAHNTQVLSLTDHLRKNGFEANNDQLLIQTEGSISLDRMMVEQLTNSDKVIVVLSELYAKKADGYFGGVGVEYEFIISDIRVNPKKYILVALESYKPSLFPTAFRSRILLDLTTNDGMKKLLHKLTDQPQYKASAVADNVTELTSYSIPAFEFKVRPQVDVTMQEDHDDYASIVWDVEAARTAFFAALSDGRSEIIKAVIRENSFLLFDIYERKMSALPIFHNIPFGRMKADFAWLDDASNGPQWFLLKVGQPHTVLFDASGMPTTQLLAEIDEVKAWANYFELNPADKKHIFGAVSQFRFRLVIGTAEAWRTERASMWRMQHNKNSVVEIRSYNSFNTSLQDLVAAPGKFYRFNRFHTTSPSSEMESFWKGYQYMDDWRKWL